MPISQAKDVKELNIGSMMMMLINQDLGQGKVEYTEWWVRKSSDINTSLNKEW